MVGHSQDILKNFQPKHDYLIGFDSDGSVFDTMEIKQKECFCPNFIKYFKLQPISKYARETMEFVGLYSKWRGINRFAILLKTLEMLADREEVKARGFSFIDLKSLRDWIGSGMPLANENLKEWVDKTEDSILKKVLEWSMAVNQSISDLVFGIPPYPFVRESLDKIVKQADLLCISQTPYEALEREWTEHKIIKYAALIAGQEFGSKNEHLKLTAVGKYKLNHILLVGDAWGDLEAAKANGTLFYPINPGDEVTSWKNFYEEGLVRFFNETYQGEYEAELINKFESLLPDTPPWKQRQV